MVGADWRRNPNFLIEHGWRATADALTYTFNRQTTPGTFLDQIRGRMWSMCWRYSDDELLRGTAAMEAAIPTNYGGFDTDLTLPITVHVRAFLPGAA
jgi:hypothetical protein